MPYIIEIAADDFSDHQQICDSGCWMYESHTPGHKRAVKFCKTGNSWGSTDAVPVGFSLRWDRGEEIEIGVCSTLERLWQKYADVEYGAALDRFYR